MGIFGGGHVFVFDPFPVDEEPGRAADLHFRAGAEIKGDFLGDSLARHVGAELGEIAFTVGNRIEICFELPLKFVASE